METARPVVLVAEDSESVLFIIEHALGGDRTDCVMRAVRDGKEAVDYLKGVNEFGDRAKFPMPDLILTDLNMPRLDGFGVLAWLRDHPQIRKLPVVVLTSSSLDADRSQAAALGAAAYVLKDVLVKNPKALVETVRQQLRAEQFR